MAYYRVSGWPTFSRTDFGELTQLRRQMDRLFEGLSAGSHREPAAGVFPLVNITEDKNSFYVRAELPGVKSSELDLSVAVDSLTISGERKISTENGQVKYHRKEREGGKFSRVVGLPCSVDTQRVEASCRDGVLVVVLPKAEASKPRQIQVTAA